MCSTGRGPRLLNGTVDLLAGTAQYAGRAQAASTGYFLAISILCNLSAAGNRFDLRKDINPGRTCDGLKYLMALLTYIAQKLILTHFKSHDILGLVDQRTFIPKKITLRSKGEIEPETGAL